MTASPHTSGRAAYATVTAAYWGFTLTDGALRMLVLLHFHRLGFSVFDLAALFLLYEVMGIVTNLWGGWLAARWGLRFTLLAGLALQVVALLALSVVSPAWSLGLSVAWVMASQAVSGIAKDLTKMSSKSAVKLVVKDSKDTSSALLRWVAALTGSKNALKGAGFFLGGVLLDGLGFTGALWGMAAALAMVWAAVWWGLSAGWGQLKQKETLKSLFSTTAAINWLAAARLFLFASRDVWFVVAVPVFLSTALGWSGQTVGAFLAAWVIGYGIVQGLAPAVLRGAKTPEGGARAAVLWGAALLALVMALAGGESIAESPWLLVGGLFAFAVVFAVNSALHSYLIVAYADDHKIATTVGFYYAANACGRLFGTLLSGISYGWGGLSGSLWVSVGLVALALLCSLPLRGAVRRSGLS